MGDRANQPLRDQVADRLRTQIVNGQLVPGTRMREEHIAEEQGVSRVPVREALQRLESEGYLVLTPRRGATVAAPSPKRALELMEVRRALENLAVRSAAENGGGHVAAELTKVVERGFAAIKARKHNDIPTLIDRFHELVVLAADNAELVALLDDIRPRVRWMFEVDLEHRSEGSWSDHQAILEAILARDARKAVKLMDAHVAKDEQLYRQMML